MAKKVSCGIRSKIMKREVEVKVEMNVERGEKRLVVMDDSGVRRAKEGRNKPPWSPPKKDEGAEQRLIFFLVSHSFLLSSLFDL